MAKTFKGSFTVNGEQLLKNKKTIAEGNIKSPFIKRKKK